jgi:hypothetical protein
MDNHTTRVYWLNEDELDGATPGWEAQRNDGHCWAVDGDIDDDDATIMDYTRNDAPAGLDAGTVTVER